MTAESPIALSTSFSPKTASPHPLRDAPRGLLTQAVRHVTNLPDAQPRGGQGDLHDAIQRAMTHRRHHVGQAPTGSGKSLACLAPAFEASILRGERTVVSTDSLALMGQLEDKDVATVRNAARDIYPDASVQVAFLKGVSNYLDADRVMTAAQKLTGLTKGKWGELADDLERQDVLSGMGSFPKVEPHEHVAFRDLIVWALRVYDRDDEREVGDRHSCPVEHATHMWQAVSASASESSDGKRYGVTPKIEFARLRAGESDIVVTNHSMLAVQAAKGVPVILGSERFGVFNHVVIDEAHTLPGHVRSQGAAKLSGGVLLRAANKVTSASGNSTSGQRWKAEGEMIADQLDRDLKEAASAVRDKVLRLGADDDVISEYVQLISTWSKQGAKMLGLRGKSDVDALSDIAEAKEYLADLSATVSALTRHRTGWARWVEHNDGGGKARPWWEANVSPIDVAFLLRDNLWGLGDNAPDGADDAGGVPTAPVSVSAISATMPSNYPSQAGLNSELVKYPSPFKQAYAKSALYVPKVTGGADLDALTAETRWGRKFATHKHAAWAAELIVKLVEASGGRALVLAAKAADGRMYAERLREALPQLTIHDQWEGGSGVVAQWREDVDSVLVGTKSMATGIDPQGDTCQLVIIDRVPRAPQNPIDEARVEMLTARGVGEWPAKDFVYAIDASLMMKQAVGRLIRGVNDSGAVAILDPRLVKADSGRRGPLTYGDSTRSIYMETVNTFGQKTTQLGSICGWLQHHRDGDARAA